MIAAAYTRKDFFCFPIEIDNAGTADTAIRSRSCTSEIGVSVGAVIVVVCLVAIVITVVVVLCLRR